ncbi:hypothetical protein HG536_0B06570 [Torulaspora globosa]|uniref:Rab-GAP TBC domain-containing protein n=1 Tax=Torulaspora globosa TaxID=48254 RepID=A0A7G3ZE53_9SACH|nr:uncharacterized protein HG536_0B06570 [Torulaspora globosa]QLL31789.1 hypothetical protein HG536_0B06570 [Torulaspora globosa]
MNLDGYSPPAGQSLSSSDESLSLNCDLLTESLFDEQSLVNFFNEQQQRDFKTRVIREALADHNVDALSVLGMSNFGFVNTALRKESWLALLTSQLRLDSGDADGAASDVSREHVDENQVQLDVRRSFPEVKDQQRKALLRKVLESTIIRLLRKHRKLRYYQGYHDVVSVFVTVYIEGYGYHGTGQNDDNLTMSDLTSRGEESHSAPNLEEVSNSGSSASTELYEGEISAKDYLLEDKLFKCVESFTLLYLRDFMMDSLDFPIDQLKIIPQMIKSHDKRLFKQLHLDKVEPFFAISSILTIFSHELKPSSDRSDSQIYQIFDHIIASQSMLVPLTMYSTLIMESKDTVLKEYAANATNFENTVDLVHGVMQNVLVSASYDERVWRKILYMIRSRPVKDNPTKYKKTVNQCSVLTTTASGQKRNTSYELKYVTDLLDREIEQNSKRKALQLRRKLRPQETKPFLRLVWYAHNHAIPFVCRLSLLIGVIALLIKLYRDGSTRSWIPTAKYYARKFQHSYIAGLYQGSKIIWLDPLHELLKNSFVSKASQFTSSSARH